MSADHLRFLDFFCVLFALLFINSAFFGSSQLPFGLILAATIAFVAAWYAWRAWPTVALAWIVAGASLAVLFVANSPVSVMSVWLGIVALAVTSGRAHAQILSAIVVAATVGIHLFSGSSATKLLIEVVAMVTVVFAGLALARTILSAITNQEELRAANEKLRQSLNNSRELALSHERERVAASLHDGLGHRLTTIGLGLDYATRMLERDPAKAREELSRARQSTTDALNAMRSTVRAMKPVTLIDDNLDTTLNQLASSFDGTDLAVKLEGTLGLSISEESVTMILRFVQEALTNVVRHAHANRAVITLTGTRVTVDDNGRGYDGAPDFGLTSLRQRAEALGGQVMWQPHGGIDGGFRLELEVPHA